jgi:uncharacterized membrane protein YGL010W
MILLLHIVVALGSLVAGSVLLARPSVGLLRTTYGLTAAALLSGTYMIWQSGAQLLQTCITGLLYVTLVTAAIVCGRRRLARERLHIRRNR